MREGTRKREKERERERAVGKGGEEWGERGWGGECVVGEGT